MKTSIPLLLIIPALFALAGCATGTRGYPAREGIANFDRVNNDLYRGAQPNNLGIKALKDIGIKKIIDLRQTNEVWFAEEAEAAASGITYTNVPMNGIRRPTEDQIRHVLEILESASAGSPVFIHCQHGCDRTGTIIACYRIQHCKWTSKQALAEAKQYGMSGMEFGMKTYIKDFAKHHKGE